MQAILTKYIGPSNTRGARVKATANAGSITVSYDGALNSDGNHRAAALAYANKYGWLDNGWRLEGGTLHTGEMAWVLVQAREPAIPDTRGRPWLETVRDAFIEGRWDEALAIVRDEGGGGAPFITWNSGWWSRVDSARAGRVPVDLREEFVVDARNGDVSLLEDGYMANDAIGEAVRFYCQSDGESGAQATVLHHAGSGPKIVVFSIASSLKGSREAMLPRV